MMARYFMALKDPIKPMQFSALGIKLLLKGKLHPQVPSLFGTGKLDVLFRKAREVRPTHEILLLSGLLAGRFRHGIRPGHPRSAGVWGRTRGSEGLDLLRRQCCRTPQLSALHGTAGAQLGLGAAEWTARPISSSPAVPVTSICARWTTVCSGILAWLTASTGFSRRRPELSAGLKARHLLDVLANDIGAEGLRERSPNP